jgi:hypothetical protein
MNIFKAIRDWLNRTPRRQIETWDVAISSALWELSAAAVVAVCGLIFGGTAAVALVVPALAVAAWGVWLRTGRHWHPIANAQARRRRS